jgi:adenosylcobyric acid synthase
LPGTKNTIADLEYLCKHGIDRQICSFGRNGKGLLIGVCGGYQMLGMCLCDSAGVESETKEIAGLGLLDVRTTFLTEKHLYQVEAVHLESGLPVHGYEIHMGETERGNDTRPAINILSRNSSEIASISDGAISRDGKVWGTYIHGLFDDDAFRRHFIDSVRIRKGLRPIGGVTSRYDVDAEYDKLAAVLREHLDMKKIYSVLGF